jgi:hypothetical protein
MAGCASKPVATTDPKQVKYQGYEAYAHHGESSADAQYIRFKKASGTEEFTIVLPRNLPRLVVEYEATVNSGQVIFKVLNQQGKALIGGKTDAKGHLKLYHSLRVPTGTYTVQTQYIKAESGNIRYTLYGYYR